MASPTVSFVIPPPNAKGALTVKHLLNPPSPQNSHGSIIKHYRVSDDKVLRVELEPRELANPGNDQPVPWQIDRLPLGVSTITDIEQPVLDAAENAARSFMVPENVYAYLHSNHRDVAHFVTHVFKPTYHRRWAEAVTDLPTAPSKRYVHGSVILAIQLLCPSATLVVCAPNDMTVPDVPMFTKEDIVNPAAWYRLPE